ncbi:MAG: hypothetical protein A3B96_01005 [Candidatus Spechtbacteria bacterium RIFCSPHIGHO2_02_FULL_43_15b]|uniref:FAD/NAD(P)-binding domain-containing protein n=1 Tax=Candidatus Spechtbacteria bacterium RIFCSPHIGHO2_01_FULL_43_30 TaxID=1802158 RepID=A0A1G2H7B2_9BACT|nr:MAG: hypothetical protein A2827_02290 [Candidatus Spechtbacteria bacterium RIFCSPHIGHO2_01_FULL_43_30]OGZ58994.1 MAG: hypothetical protein A3B96_01005 [Candidatus Spechtbacteria bacterium RIFCSPHIGHO2_02_FULL_43_15b]
MYDLVIIGGGPASAACAVYAARKKLKAVLITDEWGGQSTVSAGIENWIGTKNIPGFEFAKTLEEHVRAQNGIEIITGDKVLKVDGKNNGFTVSTESGTDYESKTVFVGSGASRRKLGVLGEKEYDGKGVAYCSTCDAPVFKDKAVAVVGGGNAGLEAAMDLVPYAKTIKLLEYSDKLKGDPATQDKVRESGKVEIIFNAETLEIAGDKFVRELKYKDRASGEGKKLDVEGVFIEIGSIPNSEMVKGLIETDKYGEIIVDHKNSRTSRLGIWAGGDVTDDPFKQNNISAGDGVKAALDIYNYLIIGDKR